MHTKIRSCVSLLFVTILFISALKFTVNAQNEYTAADAANKDEYGAGAEIPPTGTTAGDTDSDDGMTDSGKTHDGNEIVDAVGRGDAGVGDYDRYDFSVWVRDSEIFAAVKADSPVYKDDIGSSPVIGKVTKGGSVEVLEDTGYKWYKIRISDKLTGWVPAAALSLPPDPPVNKTSLETDQLEKYIVYKGLKSPTNYLMWVDIDRQQTHIFKRSGKEWKHARTFICSTGLTKSPTRRGTFRIQERGKWFFSNKYGSGAENWVRFSDGYLFHSVAMDKKRNITDNTLGERTSRGCVRLSVADSLWIFNNIPVNTTVLIN